MKTLHHLKRKALTLLLLVPLIACGQVKLSELPAVTSVGETDITVVVQEGTTKKATAAQIAEYARSVAASTLAPIASPTFTGTVTIPSGASIADYLTSATAASTYQPLGARLTAFSALANAGGVLANNGSGTLSYVGIGVGGNGNSDSGKLVQYFSNGGIYCTVRTRTYDTGGGSSYNETNSLGMLYYNGTNSIGLRWPTLTGNRIITLPDASGTIITTGNLSSITATGTITSGTWQGTDIALAYLAQGGASDGQYLVWDNTAGTWEPGTLDLSAYQTTAGTLALAGFSSITGTLSAANGGTGLTSLGTGVATWLGTPSSANLAAAVTGGTGTGALVFGTSPVISTALRVVKVGNESELAGLEVVDDPNNPAVRALYILPTQNSGRVYFGKTGQGLYSINFSNVSSFENVPSMSVGLGLRVGGVENTYIARGSGGTEIGANHPDGYGLDVFQDDSYNTAVIAHRALNVHRTNGVTYYSTSTSRTDYEGLNLGTASSVHHFWSVKGSTGGTARDVVLGFDSTEKARVTSAGFQIGTRGSAMSAVATVVKASHDCASIAAGATETTTATITGAAAGGTFIPSPIIHEGLVISAARTGTDTVTITFYNPTTSAIDASAVDVRVTEIAF